MEIAIAYAVSKRRRGPDYGLERNSPDLVTSLLAHPLDVLQEDMKTAHDCVPEAFKIPAVPYKEAPAEAHPCQTLGLNVKMPPDGVITCERNS
jgi:hypothetical protein